LQNSGVRVDSATKVCWSQPSRAPGIPMPTILPPRSRNWRHRNVYGVAKNHAFVDGNKRAAFLCIGLFLAINGYRLTAPQVDAIETMLSVAAGTMTEEALGLWIAQNSKER